MTEGKLIRDFTPEEIQSLVDHLNSTRAERDSEELADSEMERLKKEVVHFIRLAAEYEEIIKQQQDEIDLLKS